MAAQAQVTITITIQQINAAFNKALAARDVREHFLKLGSEPTGGSDANLQAIINCDTERETERDTERDTERRGPVVKPSTSPPIDASDLASSANRGISRENGFGQLIKIRT